MSKIINVGRVTSYADAVAGGYTGTREEWEIILANLGTTAAEVEANRQEVADNTQAVADDKADVEADKASVEQSAAAAAQSAENAHTDALAATEAKEAAQTAQGLANEARADAVNAKTAAESAQSEADTSAEAAAGSALAAGNAAQTATTQAGAASDSATAAAQSAAAAAESARTLTIDTTLTQAGQAADAKKVGDEVADLKSALNRDALYGNLLGYGKTSYGKAIKPQTGGEIPNENFDTTDFIPVSDGELLYSNITTRCAFYDSEKALVSTFNFSVKPLLFSEVSDVRYAIVPTGAVYFRVSYRKDLTNSCFLCRPNVYDIVYGQKIEEIVNNRNEITTKTNFWDCGTVLDDTSINAKNGTTGMNVDYKTTDFIPVTPGTTVYGYGARFYCYDKNKTAISGKTGVLNTYGEALSNGMHYYKIPEGAAFFRISANKTITEHDDFQIYSTDIFETILHEAEPVPEPVDTRKLYTLGDSITRGMYAEEGATSSSGPTPQGYPYWIGQIAGYEVVNLGNSGSGWANVGSAETAGDPSTARNAKDVVDDNTFADADIITMAWGVNDWKGAAQNVVLGDMSSSSGDGTVIGNMKYCIETLVTKKPTAQLIVLLPLNTNRQWSGMREMTLAENWAFGYPYRNNQTLEDYRAAIRQCAEYYNVKVIDLEEVCPINRLNLRNVCGDGLHPTRAFHKQMGQALASLIT